ncbi:hypothetical protein D9M68_979630 [compost metagenome]
MKSGWFSSWRTAGNTLPPRSGAPACRANHLSITRASLLKMAWKRASASCASGWPLTTRAESALKRSVMLPASLKR